jgi:hypothetical protein
MMTQQEEDAKLGRVMRWIGRWTGASLLICVVLTLFFGERSQWSNWILTVSLIGGGVIAYLLARANDNEEKTRT